MSEVRKATMQGPPVAEVAPGDVVYVPVFATDVSGGNPFWLRITQAEPPEGGGQYVTGVRVRNEPAAAPQPESARTVSLRLPLDRISRRVFVPTQPPPQPARGVAPVERRLPQRPAGGQGAP